MKTREDIANKILLFLDTYAIKDEKGNYTSPDAYSLLSFIKCLQNEDLTLEEINIPISFFDNGGYALEGEDSHVEIIKLIKDFFKKNDS